MTFPAAHPGLLRALAERGYLEPTLVQSAVLEADAARDLLVSAKTGSGKTVAYGLAIAPTLLGEAERMPSKAQPLALIVAPTRELAMQVQRELQWLYAPVGAKIVACVGGMDIRSQEHGLNMGAHIIVGTPGRLIDLMERKRLKLETIKAVVLDEADEMLDLGFRDDLETILSATPTERRTLLFSATIPKGIATLARTYQRDALRISTADGEEQHGDIEYRAVTVNVPREREHAVVNLLRFFDVRGALVFCSTRDMVTHVCGNLLERGFAAVPLSGELSQAERNRALQGLREGRARVCVATDVAARGLDLPDLGLVIHADLPRDRAMLLHRSGRTGRAGRKGVACLLVSTPQRRLAERILGDAGIEAVWSPPPSAEQVREKDRERLATEITTMVENPTDEDTALATTLLAERNPIDLAVALVRMQRNLLPSPEEIAPPRGAPSRGDGRGDSRGSNMMRDDRRPDVRRPEPRGDARDSRAAPRGAAHDEHRDAPAPRATPPRGGGESVWFRLNVGRFQNADPRWLIPLICRRGGVTKPAIGSIRILARETLFEVSSDVATAFAASAKRPDPKDPKITIVTADEPTSPGDEDKGAPSRGPGPRRGPPAGGYPPRPGKPPKKSHA